MLRIYIYIYMYIYCVLIYVFCVSSPQAFPLPSAASAPGPSRSTASSARRSELQNRRPQLILVGMSRGPLLGARSLYAYISFIMYFAK